MKYFYAIELNFYTELDSVQFSYECVVKLFAKFSLSVYEYATGVLKTGKNSPIKWIYEERVITVCIGYFWIHLLHSNNPIKRKQVVAMPWLVLSMCIKRGVQKTILEVFGNYWKLFKMSGMILGGKFQNNLKLKTITHQPHSS